MNNNRNVSTFSPFITFCQHVIPLAYDESMSYYETLCALRDYLVNTVIPAVNNNADAVTELQNKYTEFTNKINETVKELEDYINNYFENLDVQTEINNKLDEMAADGTLLKLFKNFIPIITPEMFGAIGDNESDDTNSIQNAINYACENNLILLFTKKFYKITSLNIDKPIYINGNNSTLNSQDNNNDYVLQLINDGLNKSLIKNIKINVNNENINGLKIYSKNYKDTYTILDNIECFNGKYGIYISGNYSNSSVRELKIINCIQHHNLDGINSDSCTDSYIINNTSFENKRHGINLIQNASIKINDSKCFMNGKQTNGALDINRIPASAFNLTSDSTPIPQKNYYTRTGNGNWQYPYTFTKFAGASFEEDTDYYELTGNYQNHGNGIFLNNCDTVLISNVELQGNCGDGVYCDNCNNLTINNIACHINGYMWDEEYNVIKYDDVGLKPYFYGIYLNKGNYININGLFFNENVNEYGYIQKSSVFVNSVNIINLNILSRALVNLIEYINIKLDSFNCLINGNTLNIDIDLQNITLNEGYSIIDNDWNGTYIYVKNNIVYFKLAIQNNNTIPTGATSIGKINLTKPILQYILKGISSLNYSDDADGDSTLIIDSGGNIKINNKLENAKFLSFQGSYIIS